MIEGRIVQEWGELIERDCRRWRDAGRAVALDLARVAWIDAPGVERLRRLVREGVPVLGASPLIEDLLRGDDTP